MIINQIIVFAIVASIFLGTFVQGGISDDELTLDQLGGQWYEVGKISNCVANVRPCSTYEIKRFNDSEQEFTYFHVPIENVHNCAHGVPIYTYPAFGTLFNSTLYIKGSGQYAKLASTVESYNDGTELILFDAENEHCESPSYKLWSRKREASEKTKMEFEKLAENANLQYYFWDDCPKLRSETNDEFTFEQFEGLWYDIAKIYYGDVENDTCTEYNVTVNYENKTLNITSTTIRNGTVVGVKRAGTIVGSVVYWKEMSADDNNDGEMVPSSVISCNSGTELLWRNYDIPNFALLSRYPEVPKETIVEFKRLAGNFGMYADLQFTVYYQDNCPNRSI